TKLESHPRMADAAQWVAAAEQALGWTAGTFASVYDAGREQAAGEWLDSDPVSMALGMLLLKRDSWTGTATELMAELEKITSQTTRRDRAWPAAPRALSSRLRRAAKFLRDTGIHIDFDLREYGEERRRLISFRKI